MAEKVNMTALSPTMEEGLITKWVKKEGEKVSSGDILCEVETDKANMEYESFQEGTLLKIILAEGEKCEVGKPIAILGNEGEDISDILDEIEQETETETETEKKTDESNNGSTNRKEDKSQEKKSQKSRNQQNNISSTTKIKASPLARKIADENSIELKRITGSGPNGRIVKRDIEEFMSSSSNRPTEQKTFTHQEDKTIPLSGTRKVIASRLAESKFSAPHFYLSLSIDMTNILNARKALNSKRETKISLNAYLVKLAAQAISKHPFINASWRDDSILVHGNIDIALAVEKEEGLITPVVRNCYQKGLIQIDDDFSELIRKTRENKLSPDEYQNASFTISNLGSFGIEEFTAIINPPGSAILAVGKITKTPVVNEKDEIEIRPLMKVTLSCDHRVIDGATGARFLKDFKEMIENPVSALY